MFFRLLFAIAALGATIVSHAQTITRYTFASSAGSFTPLAGATTVALSGGDLDEGYYNHIPIGFDFWYMGVRYTTLSASTNGWITPGTAIASPTPLNSLQNGGSPRPVLAPLWDDLAISPDGSVSYQTSGTTGSRVFTLQYLNVRWSKAAAGSSMSFQVRLYEQTGKVEYTYRQESTAANSPSASIGISSITTGSGNFLSVNNTGSSATSSSEHTITSRPITGNRYGFTPPVATSPSSLIFSEVTSNSMRLSWSDRSSNEVGFVVYSSTDGTNYQFVTQLAANATTANVTGLASGVDYSWRVYAVTEGGLSAALEGEKSTLCTTPPLPVVQSPVTYCLNQPSTPLTAVGQNLKWGGLSGSAGGTTALETAVWTEPLFASRRTRFRVNSPQVVIQSIDYYIAPWQSVNGYVISIYNSNGSIVATSSTRTSMSAGSTPVRINNTFNYTVPAAGEYSVGVSSGYGNIGYDSPTFPLTEETGTVSITGVSSSSYRCFNNIIFTMPSTSIAPTPNTSKAGTQTYYVSQTINGCVSNLAAIEVIVQSANLSQLPTTGLVGHYTLDGTAKDETNTSPGTAVNSPSSVPDRFNDPGKAFQFNGSNQYIWTTAAYASPNDFTIGLWFNTTTAGGRLIGFGNSQSEMSSRYDRHIYMNDAGQLYFGIYPDRVVTINTPLSYNDGKWHHVMATLSSVSGMALYVDGSLVVSNASERVAEAYTGYWRIAYDNNNGWTSQPTNYYFKGMLDEAVVYAKAITPTEVSNIFKFGNGAGNNGPVCAGSTLNLNAKTIAGATYAWRGPNGFSSSLQNPALTFSAAAAGLYSVDVTSNGCTITAYSNVSAIASEGQWTGAVDANWSNPNNWCNGQLPTSSTDVIIGSSAVRMPSISSVADCRNLSIQLGSSLTTTASGTLRIAGTLLNQGTMANGGTTSFTGTGDQSFSGVTQFHNLTLASNGTLTIPSSITINGGITITSGILNANNFPITVKGDWSNNGSASALTASTQVTFDGSLQQTIGGTSATTFNTLTLRNVGPGVVLAAAAKAENVYVGSGVFDIGSWTLSRNTTGGTLAVANNSTLRIGGTNTLPASYTSYSLTASSTVEYYGNNQAVANVAYGNLLLSGTSGAVLKTLPSTPMAIHGSLTLNKGNATTLIAAAESNLNVGGIVTIGASTEFQGGAYTHTVNSNWINNGTFRGGSGTIVFNGAGTTVSGTGSQLFNNVSINAALVNFSSGVVNLSGNLEASGAGTLIQNAAGTVVMDGSDKTISGNGIRFGNLRVNGSVSTTSSFEIQTNLEVAGSFTATAGTITLTGSSGMIAGNGAKNFFSVSVPGSITTTASFSVSSGFSVGGSFNCSGGTATFLNSSTLSGKANFHNVEINGTSLRLSAESEMGVGNDLTLTSGLLDVASVPNTVVYNGKRNQSVAAIAYHNLTLSDSYSRTAAGPVTVNNDLTIGTGSTFNGGSYTHTVMRDWINEGAYVGASGKIVMSGAANRRIKGVTTFNILEVNSAHNSVETFLETNITTRILNATRGIIVTRANMLTITETRTGPGIIDGTVNRTHPFVAGVPYAFRSDKNTVTFASVSNVNSVTVSATESEMYDFPFQASVHLLYDIKVPQGSYVATLRLDYEESELNGNDEASMKLWRHNGTGWAMSGRTDGSSDANWVEKSSISDITGKWTLSDDSNVVSWNGSVSSEWNNPMNWTVVQGSATVPPTPMDVVTIGSLPFVHQPVISTPATTNVLHFGDAQAVTLTLAPGGSLTTTGNLLGTWQQSRRHSIHVNDQQLRVMGDLLLGNGMQGRAIDLNLASGIVEIAGSINQSGGAVVTTTGNGRIIIHENFNLVLGTFEPGTGSVVYAGNQNQNIAQVRYYNVEVNKPSGVASIGAATQIDGNLSIDNGYLSLLRPTVVKGSVHIGQSGHMDGHSALRVAGNWLNEGEFISHGDTIYFDGGASQDISSSTFGSVIIEKPVGSMASLTGDITVKGDFRVQSGTMDVNTFSCDRDVPGGNLIIADAATFVIAGNNAPINYTGGYVGHSSTVIADGESAQYIIGAEFGNFVLRNAGLKVLVAPITVHGDFTIEQGSTFNAGSETITLNGSWKDRGAFVAGSSTMIFNGIQKTIEGNSVFHRAVITGDYTIINNVTFDVLLDIRSSGAIRGGESIHTTMNGDLINEGILRSLGTTTFSGNVKQVLRLINSKETTAMTVFFNGSVTPVLLSTAVPQYGQLTINNTGGVNPSVGWNILLGLTVNEGASFNGGVFGHTISGNFLNRGTITSEGTITFNPAVSATIDFGSDFSSSGNVNLRGAGAIAIKGSPRALRNVTVANTNTAGITPSSDWSLAGNLTIDKNAKFNASGFTYHIGGNLRSFGEFNAGASHIIIDGTSEQFIECASPMNNVTVDKDSSAVVQLTDVTLTGSLNFIHGKWFTQQHTVYVTSGSSVTGASSTTGWVSGNLAKRVQPGNSVEVFEIGDANHYVPVEVAFTGASGSGYVTTSTTAGKHPQMAFSGLNSINTASRYWTINSSGVNYTSYSPIVQTCGTEEEHSNLDPVKVRGALYSNSSWSIAQTNTSGDPLRVQFTGMHSMGDLVVAENCHAGTEIAYSNNIYCQTEEQGLVTINGSAGGIFTSFPGLSINETTGQVNPKLSVPGRYSVTYTIPSSEGCASYAALAVITIDESPQASISYPGTPFCSSSEIAAVTVIGKTGGLFSSAPGLVIDPNSGTVNLEVSTAGDYEVTYTNAPTQGCSAFQASTIITITPQPFATGTYEGNPYCNAGGIAAPTGSFEGLLGTLTSTSGLAIDPATGVIDLGGSTAGIYTVNYQVDAYGGCSAYANTATVSISENPKAQITYPGAEYCQDAVEVDALIIGTQNGTFSSMGGLSINPVTGRVSPQSSSAGEYEVSYLMRAPEGCTDQTASAAIVITPSRVSTISYDGSPFRVDHAVVPVTLSGLSGGVFTTSDGLTLESSTGLITPASSTPGSYSVTYSFAATEGCPAFATQTTLEIIDIRLWWDGGAGTIRWEDPSNWSTDALPSLDDIVVLNNADSVLVNTAVSIRSISIEDPSLTLRVSKNGSMTINGDVAIEQGQLYLNGQLALTGDWTNNATFLSRGGTVVFNGLQPQALRGTSRGDFDDIRIENISAEGVSVETSQRMRGVLSLVANAKFDADGSRNTSEFTMLSTNDNPATDAAIDKLPVGAVVSGRVIVQRFMSQEGVNKRLYRYISSPVRMGTIADIQQEIPVTGNFTGTSKCTGCAKDVSLFQYLEPTITDINNSGVMDMNDGYFGYPLQSNQETFAVGRGYAMFVRGNIIPSSLWDLRGEINRANVEPIPFPVSYTSSGTDQADGWNLVGNPFPSTIDWNAESGWTKENINGAIYITDNGSGAAQFATWNGLVGTNGGSQYIATGQGFWVKASKNGVPILSADENVKAPRVQTTFFRSKGLRNLLRITMSKGAVKDETIIHFREDATDGFDGHADAIKLINATINISSASSDGTELSINSLSALNCAKDVTVNIGKPAAGSYQLNFSELSTFAATTAIEVYDKFLNTTVSARGGAYAFSVTASAASYGSRFEVRFRVMTVEKTFNISASDVCEGKDSQLVISNSQTGALYKVVVGDKTVMSDVPGTGGQIGITLNSNDLKNGLNRINVIAIVSDCDAREEKSITLTMEQTYGITKVFSAGACEPGSVTLMASGAPEAGSYNWYKTNEPTERPIEGQHSNTFITPALIKSETFYVAAVNSLGCEDQRQKVTAHIGGLAPATITVYSDSLVSSYSSGNQWYYQGEPIDGATLPYFNATKEGVYTLVVADGACKTQTSVDYIIAGFEELPGNRVSLYPNPVKDSFTISLGELKSVKEIQILNMLGANVWSTRMVNSDEVKIDTELRSGVYLVRIIGDRGTIGEVRFVKL